MEEMTLIVDLVIVAVIALCIIFGYIRGLTGALIKILSFVLSIVIAFILFVPVSNLIIQNTQIDESLETSIRETILKQDTEASGNKMPTTVTEYINAQIEEGSNQAKEAIVDTTARDVSIMIVKAGTWILLFVVARVILICLKFITGLIAKLPVIKQFDKIGGVIYGLIEGLVITYVALAIISFIAPITSNTLTDTINQSYLGSKMYNNNLLLKIIF